MSTRRPRRARDLALMTLGSSLPVLQRGYRAAADQAVAHLGISQALAWPLLMIARHGDGLRPGALAEMLGIEGPSLVRSLDQLEHGGFIERRADEADRRARTLHLTEAGGLAAEQIEQVLIEMRTALFDGVGDEDIAACLRLFDTLRERLGCSPAQALPARSA